MIWNAPISVLLAPQIGKGPEIIVADVWIQSMSVGLDRKVHKAAR